MSTAVLAYAINSLWQVPLVGVVGWAVARMLHAFGPGVKHRVWVATLLLQAVFPACAAPAGLAWLMQANVMAGSVVNRFPPIYPPDAKQAKVQGAVVMKAIIGKQGEVQSLSVLSGPEPLRQSATDAVKRWTYKPYLLNGQPTEVSTTITVTYSLGK